MTSKKSHQLLMEHMPDAMMYLKKSPYEHHPLAFSILEVNRAFEKMTKIPKEDLIGKQLGNVFPDLKEKDFDWIKRIAKRILKGEDLSFQQYIHILKGWYSITIYHQDPHQIVTIIHDITSMKKMEEAFKEGERRFKELFEGSRDGFVMVDTCRRIIDANNAYCTMLGYQLHELKAMESFQCITPEKWWKWEKEEIWDKRLMGIGYSGLYEKEYIRKDGVVFPVELQSYVVKDQKGEISYLWGIARDITYQKQVQEALEESEKNFRLAAESAPIGIVISDRNERTIYLNQKFVELFGYTLQDIPSVEEWWPLAYPDEGLRKRVKETWKREIKKAMEKKTEINPMENPITCKDGTIRQIEIRMKPMGHQNMITFVDNTHRKKTEETLRESEEKLNYFFSQSLNGFFFMMLDEPIIWNDTIDKEKVLKYVFHHQRMTKVNQAILDQYRAKEKDFIGLTPYQLFKHDLEHGYAIWQGLFEKGRWHVVTNERRLDGTQLWVEGDYICMYDSSGRITGHFGVQTDITEKKEREESLRASQRRSKGQRIAITKLLLDDVIIDGELPKALDRITEILSDTILVERASIWTIQEGGTFLKCLSLFEATPRKHSHGTVINGENIPSYYKTILKEGRISIEDTKKDYRTRDLLANYLKPLGITSILDTAIVMEGKIEGIICLEHMGEKRRWYPDEEAFLSTVASMVSQVFMNAKRKELNQSLKFQLECEKMLADISSFLLSLPNGHIHDGINYALEKIAELFSVDRSYLFQFSSDGKTMSNTHEWCAPGIKSVMDLNQQISIENLTWWRKELQTKNHVCIHHIQDLPPEAEAEKREFLWDEISSLLCVPVIRDGGLFGFLGFDCVHQKKRWTNDHILLLKVITEIIANALIREKALDTIHYLSFHDRLTGLYNRHYLEEEMKRLDKKRQLPISIIMADLNGLKLVNDTYGHIKGDQLLKTTGTILKKACRGEDIIARWGGDEFVIFLPQTSGKEAHHICNRIINESKGEYVHKIPLSIALGTATKKELSQNLYDILSLAEKKMYRNKLSESRSARSAVLTSLVKTLEEKSQETEEHTSRMGILANKMGKKIGLLQEELHRLKLLTSLHDIGKIIISQEILNKPGKLTEEEWQLMKAHPETGYRIARSTEEISHVAEEILSHHEWWDGSGYPHGVAGKDIPLLARINAIVDAYDVMTNERPYKRAMDQKEAISELERCAGIQFDPSLVNSFLELFFKE